MNIVHNNLCKASKTIEYIITVNSSLLHYTAYYIDDGKPVVDVLESRIND